MSNLILKSVEKKYNESLSNHLPNFNYVLDGIYEVFSDLDKNESEIVSFGNLEKRLKDVCEIRTIERADSIEENMRVGNKNNRVSGGYSERVTQEDVEQQLDYFKNLYSKYLNITKNILSTPVEFTHLINLYVKNNENIQKVIKYNQDIKIFNMNKNNKYKRQELSHSFFQIKDKFKKFYDGFSFDVESINNEYKDYFQTGDWRQDLATKNSIINYANELNKFRTGNIKL